jgi:hypothetical protein
MLDEVLQQFELSLSQVHPSPIDADRPVSPVDEQPVAAGACGGIRRSRIAGWF